MKCHWCGKDEIMFYYRMDATLFKSSGYYAIPKPYFGEQIICNACGTEHIWKPLFSSASYLTIKNPIKRFIARWK